MVACIGSVQNWAYKHAGTDLGGAHEAQLSPGELLTIQNCEEEEVIVFSDVGTGELLMPSAIAPHPCLHSSPG